MSGAHAFLPPSSAFRWVRCALSASLEAAYPETEDSPEAMEGTAAHWVNECTLTQPGTPVPLDTPAPNGVPVTREMLEGAALVAKTIEGALGPDWPGMLAIERTVAIPAIHPTKCFGTPDYHAWGRLADGQLILYLFDYKYGYGLVEVAENDQLITYASGLLSQIPNLDDQNTVVAMCVIQPRAYHRDGPVRWWKVKASDLRAQVNILRMQAERATGPNPPAQPDPVACENCKGRHACEALQRASYLAADKAQQAQAIDLTPHALGLELRALTRAQSLLNARVTGLHAQAEATIRQGKLVPFWSMESTPGRLKWTKPVAEILAVGEMLGIPVASQPSVITPTQAKGVGFPVALLSMYAKRDPDSMKLKYDDGTKARLTFTSSDT